MEKVGELSVLDPETEFLASKKETGNEWELFKENVRPLKRGRHVNLLNHALKSNTDFQLKKSLLDKRRALIEAIDEYKGEDPLKPWLQCIKWVQEAFPSGGDTSGLIVIYEQCVRSFWHDERYKDDIRYLNVWLEYADNCVDAENLYKFLEANKIGLTHSSFYIAYALHMESQNKITTANDIFHRGVSMNAKPEEKLKESFRKFITRCMRRPKPAEEELSEEHHHPMRSFGTLLPSSRGEARTQTAGTCDFSRKKMKQVGTQGSLIPIYKDKIPGMPSAEEAKLEKRSWHCLGARAERNKENQAAPSKWTSNKIPQRNGLRNRGATTPITPCLEIFVDEECAKTNEKHPAGEKVELRRADDGDIKRQTELLRENPLRYFPPSSLPR